MRLPFPEFQIPRTDIYLMPGDVHIWRATLDQRDSVAEKFRSRLCMNEKVKSDRFRFGRDRKRFVIGRGLLKTLIAKYLEITPESVGFCYRKNGKPFLRGNSNNEVIRFNVSHSEDIALYAFSRSAEIGIDVEKVRDFPEMASVAECFFSEGERAMLVCLPKNKQKSAFFTIWTRREALLKVSGDGLSEVDKEADVAMPDNNGSYFSPSSNTSTDCPGYFIRDLHPCPGFAGAVAAEAEMKRISCWQWQV